MNLTLIVLCLVIIIALIIFPLIVSYIAEKDELEQNNSFKDSLKFVNNKLIHINGGNNGK